MIVIAVLGVLMEGVLLPMGSLLSDVAFIHREVPRQARILHAFSLMRSALSRHSRIQVLSVDRVALLGDDPLELRREQDGHRLVFLRPHGRIVVDFGTAMHWGPFSEVSENTFSHRVTIGGAVFPMFWRAEGH